MKIVLALALLGHILCGVCDCLLSYSPSGRIDLAGVLKDANKMRDEFKALPLSWPMASILLGVAAITMFGFGYLELSKWMGTFSHTASTIMYISSIVFLIPIVVHHIICGLVEWLYFAITLKENGKVIGEIEAYPETGEPHADENTPMDTFSPCWMLNLQYQGKGYAFEAAHAFFDYLFKEKGARRIYAYTEDNNLPSQHLCEKLGMRREGLFMEFVSFINNPDGTPHYENTMQYAILRKEWQNNG